MTHGGLQPDGRTPLGAPLECKIKVILKHYKTIPMGIIAAAMRKDIPDIVKTKGLGALAPNYL